MIAPPYQRRQLAFTVPGTPVPQGSKSAFVVKGRAVVAESNRAKLKPYRAVVSQCAAEAMAGAELYAGPVRVRLQLVFPRPKAHFVADDPARDLKASAPVYMASRPDAEKVARAIADALTGVVFRDDAQVSVWEIEKMYGTSPRAIIGVDELPTDRRAP
jgi:Holliday junction resolvase RusA-like endonuclease